MYSLYVLCMNPWTYKYLQCSLLPHGRPALGDLPQASVFPPVGWRLAEEGDVLLASESARVSFSIINFKLRNCNWIFANIGLTISSLTLSPSLNKHQQGWIGWTLISRGGLEVHNSSLTCLRDTRPTLVQCELAASSGLPDLLLCISTVPLDAPLYVGI